MDKIAVTCEENSLDAQVDPRFGRAAGFLIVDPDTMEFEYINNGSTQVMAQGAGIQAAESIAKSGAKILLTGNVGPKAFQGLEAAGIKIGQNLDSGTVRQAIEKFKAGDVDFASSHNKTGHWK
ncbi:MAG: NifB/NifX family molybdenum-iron cluster-binding protein [Desulfobacteraceae bacterium]|nr:NifB/NifX family molybdenum-iron cluster-binding protein [Desulfobacteraceae bacterium]